MSAKRVMRAAVLYGPHDVRIEDRPVPDFLPNEALIKVSFGAVCGSDLHHYEGQRIDTSAPAWLDDKSNGRGMGHEYMGRVVEVGSEVSTIKVGARVAVVPRGPCGACRNCRAGWEQQCLNKITMRTAGWVTYATCPASLLYVVPDEVSDECAAFTEALACCVRAFDRAHLRFGESVAVVGAGPMGLMLVSLAKQGGARKVIVSEPKEYRRTLAKKMGADVVIDPTQEDLLEVVRTYTDGYGVDVTFEAVGKGGAAEQSIAVTGVGGRVVLAGLADVKERMVLSPNELFFKELSIYASWGNLHAFGRALDLFRVIDFTPLVTHVFSLERTKEAMELSLSGECGKVLIQCS